MCIDKNKVLELGLVVFNFVASKVVLQDLVGWNTLQGFLPICARLWVCCSNYYRKFVNFSTNLGILFSSTVDNNSIKYMHFDHSTPIVCDPMQS